MILWVHGNNDSRGQGQFFEYTRSDKLKKPKRILEFIRNDQLGRAKIIYWSYQKGSIEEAQDRPVSLPEIVKTEGL